MLPVCDKNKNTDLAKLSKDTQVISVISRLSRITVKIETIAYLIAAFAF